MIYSCLSFNNELDLLEMRFSELFEVVDRFVIAEGNKTFSGKPKPYYFKDNLARFSKYLSKVSHVMVDDWPDSNPWTMERYQRDSIRKALAHCQDNDIIIITDADEIPSAAAITNYKIEDGLQALEMDLYYYNEHTKSLGKWLHSKIMPYSIAKQHSFWELIYAQKYNIPFTVIPDAGKHLSYFGDVNSIIKKIEDGAHWELNIDKYKDPATIQKAIDEGLDLFGRPEEKLVLLGAPKESPKSPVRYNLGCGGDYKAGFINVDLHYPRADVLWDLTKDWGFAADNTADFVFASHILEHLPDKMHAMNELYRIMKVGATAELFIPSTDGRGAFQDPTHVSFWNANSWVYWCNDSNSGLMEQNQRCGFNGAFKMCFLEEQELPYKTIITHVIIEKVARPSKPQIYDCFTFNNEFNILETRLSELYDAVDWFVIVEADKTHSNKPKPLYFQDNIARFEKYRDKIIVVTVKDYPRLDPWGIERHQRDCIMRGLTSCKDHDIIIISDCDEIPNAEAIRSYRIERGMLSIQMDLFYYNMQTKASQSWFKGKILPYGMLRTITPCEARDNEHCNELLGGGKHLSYFGGIDTIIKKIEDTAHQELNLPQFKDPRHIKETIARGADIFGRDLKYEKTKIDLRDTTFLIVTQIDHQDRLDCFKITSSFIRDNFDTNVMVVELKSPIGLSVSDDAASNGWTYEFCENPEELFHGAKWMNHLIDKAQTPIVFIMATCLMVKPEQVLASVEAVRQGKTLSIPFQPDWGWTYTKDNLRQAFLTKIDWNLVDDLNYLNCTVQEAYGATCAVNRLVYREMCGGENEDLFGWCISDLERWWRVAKLGYATHWVKGPAYHLEHWRGVSSGSLDMGTTPSDHFKAMEKIAHQSRDMTTEQLEKWLFTRPWFMARKRSQA